MYIQSNAMILSSRTLLILLGTTSVLVALAFLSFGLWFAPGWSNGWQLHRNLVWPLGLSGAVFAGIFTVFFGIGLAINSVERPQVSPRLSMKALGTFSLSAASLAALPTFLTFRATAVAIWP
jgi:hypothetical protein